jgi:hypothetical protein
MSILLFRNPRQLVLQLGCHCGKSLDAMVRGNFDEEIALIPRKFRKTQTL